MRVNEQIQLVNQREGMPTLGDFRLEKTDMPIAKPGQILVRTIYLSLDPYIRKAMRGDHPGHSKLGEGEVVYGRGVCRVMQSQCSEFEAGDYIVAETGWQLCAAIGLEKVVQRIDPAIKPLSAAIGVLGMPGLTAWGSVEHLGKPTLGETLAVSAAAGPVGACVGQLAKLRGARVIGIAGSQEKCDLVVNSYGFDDCVNYKVTGWEGRLKAVCPDGIQVYHDNVGGDFLSAMAKHLDKYARVVMCGRPADYHTSRFSAVGLAPFIVKRAKVMGMVVYDFESDMEKYFKLASNWMHCGALKVKEDRAEGLENTPSHFLKLMRGENVGKSIVAVGPEKS